MANEFDRDEFERWLRDQPKQVAVVLAARSALRVYPVFVTLLDARPDDARDFTKSILLPQLRAAAASWLAGTWPSHEADRAARAAADAAAYAARAAARAAAYAADAADAADAAAYAVRAAAYAADAADAADATARVALFTAVTQDMRVIENRLSADRLSRYPLWSDPGPNPLVTMSWELSKRLLSISPDWQAWTEWYEDRLVGHRDHRPIIPELEAARVLEPTEGQWKAGPDVINPLLLEIEARFRSTSIDPDDLPTQTPEGGRFAIIDHRVTVADLREQDEVSTDPYATELHAEAGQLLSALKDRLEDAASKPTNVPNDLLDLAGRLSAALGRGPEAVGPVKLIAGLVELEEELAADDRRIADTKEMEGPALPVDARKSANALRKMLAIYVRTDGFLATMEQRAHDRDPAPVDVVAVEETVGDAIALDAADAEVAPFMERAGAGGKETVLYGGTSRNLVRTLLKIGAAVGVLGVAEAMFAPRIVKLLKKRRESLRVILKNDPEAMRLVDRVVDPLDRLYPDE